MCDVTSVAVVSVFPEVWNSAAAEEAAETADAVDAQTQPGVNLIKLFYSLPT